LPAESMTEVMFDVALFHPLLALTRSFPAASM
jgi:hypothetical protein